jgi:glycosyltransferase involved in cell wall biosynthesis
MRLFMFLPQLPYPPRSGGRIVTAPLVQGLAARHEVHVFSLLHGFDGEEEGLRKLEGQVASVTVVSGTPRLAPGPLFRALFSSEPYKVHRFWNPGLSKQAQVLAREHPPDAVHCQNFYTAKYARSLGAPKKVLYKENFETLLLDRWGETETRPGVPSLIRLERNRTLKFEMESVTWFSSVATISHRDERLFREAALEFPPTWTVIEKNLRTVLPSIDLPYYESALTSEAASPFPAGDRKNLIVTGSFNYLANVDGALWLTREVLPKLPKDRYCLWLVGQHPAEEVRGLHDPPRVHVTGSVPDVRPFFMHADASLVPLRIGGGIRLKILESLALGCPLVSTPVGCEGLWSPEDPARWEIAETPEDFAQAIERTCSVGKDRDRLRTWVRERFSPERFVSEMEALYFG